MSNKVKLPKKEPKSSPPELRVLPKPAATEEVKWLESLESVLEFALRNQGPQRTARFLAKLTERLREQGVLLSDLRTGYLRAVTHLEVGDEDVERAIEAIPAALGVERRVSA